MDNNWRKRVSGERRRGETHISFIFRCRHLHSVARDREDSRITGTRFRIYVCDPVSLLTRLHKVLCKVKAKLKLIFHSLLTVFIE